MRTIRARTLRSSTSCKAVLKPDSFRFSKIKPKYRSKVASRSLKTTRCVSWLSRKTPRWLTRPLTPYSWELSKNSSPSRKSRRLSLSFSRAWKTSGQWSPSLHWEDALALNWQELLLLCSLNLLTTSVPLSDLWKTSTWQPRMLLKNKRFRSINKSLPSCLRSETWSTSNCWASTRKLPRWESGPIKSRLRSMRMPRPKLKKRCELQSMTPILLQSPSQVPSTKLRKKNWTRNRWLSLTRIWRMRTFLLSRRRNSWSSLLYPSSSLSLKQRKRSTL